MADANIGDPELGDSLPTVKFVHYALRAFLAARGPSTSVKKYSLLYFFTPVRRDVLIVLVVWVPAQTTAF